MQAQRRFGPRMVGLVAIALLLSVAGQVRADLITYTETATATGWFGGSSFTNALVTITATANTSQVVNPSSLLFEVPDATATVAVAGLGGATFTDPTQMFSNQSVSAVGISMAAGGLDILDARDSALATYDLTTSIGPLTGTPAFNSGSTFATTAGDLVLLGISSSVTFQASTAHIPEFPTPEPSSLALLGLGTVLLGAWRKRRQTVVCAGGQEETISSRLGA